MKVTMWWALVAGLVFNSGLWAALQWPAPQFEHAGQASESQVAHEFAFTNAGPAPVTIDAVRTNCGCTTTQLAQRTYAPGESGSIRAEFAYGSRPVVFVGVAGTG